MTDPGNPWRDRSSRLLPAVLIAALAIHFGMTVLYLTPMNPLQAKLAPLLYRYMEPLFSQKWELFAPDPIVDTRMLLVSCRLHADGPEEVETPWINITTPVRQLKYRYRLTPADRLDRAQVAALFLIFGEADTEVRKLEQRQDGLPLPTRQVLQRMTNSRKQQAELGQRLLVRIASAECARRYGSEHVVAVRARMAIVVPPPFSQRSLPEAAGQKTFIEFDQAPFEAVAAY